MDALIRQIEKCRPFFEKVSRNIYLSSVKDGFISAMPVVLFSSIFLLLAYIPNIFGFYWSPEIEAIITKPYNYSMGILGIVVAATTTKSLTDAMNRNMPKNNQINNISTMLASIVCFLLISIDSIEGGFATEFMGSKGLLTSFISAFVVCNIYRVCIKNNITIKMPEQVPPNISQTFKDLIPFAISVLIFLIIDLVFRKFFTYSLAQGLIELLKPLFSAADGYLGIAIIYGAIAFFWFIGIHGPSVVAPAVTAIYYINLTANLELYQAGQQATNILTPSAQSFLGTAGGTGATFILPFIFMFLAKSKELKAVGRASVIPTSFAVNEPILFGAPIVLNPVFFIPFIFAPIANGWLFKFFVDFFKMNAFIYELPWTTPAPIGIILGCGIGLLSIVFAIVMLAMDFLIYYPFFKVYDRQKVKEEEENSNNNNEDEVQEVKVVEINNSESGNILDGKRILVLCAGGGTSGLLANALAKGAKERNINISTAANSYGAHMDLLKDFDLVVLAPQVASNYEDLKKDTDRLGIKSIAVEGKKYIELTRDADKSLAFITEIFKNN